MTRLLYFSRDYTTHDHRFLTSLAASSYETYYLRLENGKLQIEVHPLPDGIREIGWLNGHQDSPFVQIPQRTAQLRRVIREIKPDLIHAGPIQSCAFIAALSGFQPLISMSWGYDLLQDADRSWFWKMISRFTLKRSQRLIADCHAVLDKANQLGMPKNKIAVFPWGVDLDRFSPAEYPPGDTNQFTILSTRSWEPIYGVDILAKAFVIAAQKKETLQMVMLGSGSQASLLQDIFDRGGVRDRVVFPGQISQSELPRYYQMAHLYVSASHVDGSSVSLMEAMASGRPVLVSDIPGNKEWIKHGESGWLFRDGDVEDLAEKMLEASERTGDLASISIAARQLAEKRADWEKNSSLLLRAYESVLSEV